jgi:hypothetical protein
MHSLVLALRLLWPQDAQAEEKAVQQGFADVNSFLREAASERDFQVSLKELRALAERAYAINRYETCCRILDQAERVAVQMKDVAAAASVRERRAVASVLKRDYENVLRCESRIEVNEGSPEDYTAAGRFYAFRRGDWPRAIPLLARGHDRRLAEAARADSVGAESSTDRAALGDRWWILGDRCRERAVHWYRLAWPGLQGADREGTRSKLRSYFDYPPSAESSGKETRPTGWELFSRKTDSLLEDSFGHSGKRCMKLLPLSAGRGWTEATSRKFRITAGKKYVLSVWAYFEPIEGESAVNLAVFGGPKTIQASLALNRDSPFWTNYVKEITIPRLSVDAQIRAWSNHKTGFVWIDDISLRDEEGVELVENATFEDPR